MRLHCEHEIGMSADAFWKLIHAPRYEARVAEAGGLLEYRTVERKEDERQVYRRIRVTPSLSPRLQALLRFVAGEAPATYFEDQARSKRRRVVRWRCTPEILSDRVRVAGTVRVEPIDASRCRRILDGEVEVRLPGVGATIERAIVRAARELYDASAAVANAMAPGRARPAADPSAAAS